MWQRPAPADPQIPTPPAVSDSGTAPVRPAGSPRTRPASPIGRRPFLLTLGLLVALTTGCPPNGQRSTSPSNGSAPSTGTAPDPAQPDGASSSSVPLRVLVLDDSPLTEAIQREVNARREVPIQVTGQTLAAWKEAGASLRGTDAQPFDLMIFPTAALGDLVSTGGLREVPQTLQRDSKLDFDDFLPLTRKTEIRWGKSVMALPLSGPTWVLYYRADLLERAGLQPPRTWQEYGQVAQQLAERPEGIDANAKWQAVAEPTAAGWAGRMLLARAAPYVLDKSQYSTLFDLRTFDPLITSAAFERALSEMKDAVSAEPIDLAECERRMMAGEAALAISWPASARPEVSATGAAGSIRLAPLPGAGQWWETRTSSWQDRPSGTTSSVPVTGLQGRLIGVTRLSANPAAAWDLASVMSQPELGEVLSRQSAAGFPIRTSQLAKLEPWLSPGLPQSLVTDFRAAIEQTQGAAASMPVPAVRGVDEYLAALDQHVRQCLQGELSPADALQATSTDWRAITSRLGVEAQLQAYRRNLGIEP
ncbi:MAG: extracellular solute-binding protein [Pirellulales bacterium]